MEKTIIITGGSSGIGRATAILFSEKGHRVYELSRHGESLDGITHIDCDVTSPEDCQKAVQQVINETQRIDVLVSNAGMGISGPVEFTELSDIKRQFDVNLFGAINITQAVLPQMRLQRFGRIIFVSSLAAVFPIPYQGFYSASKSALNSVALALRNELASFGIDVCCMLPGDVATGFTAVRKKTIAGSDVYTHMEKAVSNMERDEQNGLQPISIARKIYALSESITTPCFSTTGIQYKLFMALRKILSTTLINRILGKMY